MTTLSHVCAYAFAVNPEPWAIGPISHNKPGPEPTLKAYQEAIRSELLAQEAGMKLGLYSVRLRFSRQLAKYVKLSNGGTAHRNQADATNMQKATEDALQGIVIGNDRDVARVESRIAGPQESTTDPWVLIEVRYGIEGYSDAETELPRDRLDGGQWVSFEGMAALMEMRKQAALGDRIQDNEWTPEV